MKKILLFALSFFSLTGLFAQEKQVFCELVGTSASLFGEEVTVRIDFGQERKAFQRQLLVDESGTAIVFNSMIDALNYMGELGWQFVQAFTITEGTTTSKSNVYHFLLTKNIKEGEKIDAGLHLLSKMKDPDDETKAIWAKQEENKAYFAYLIKSQTFDKTKKEELQQLVPFDDILQLIQTKTLEELQEMSKNHNKYFNKFRL